MIVDQLALQMLAADEAVKKGLDKSPEVSEHLEMLRQSVLANAYVQDFIKTNQITDEAVKGRVRAGFIGDERHRVQGATILVEKESEAKDIIAKLKKDRAASASSPPRSPRTRVPRRAAATSAGSTRKAWFRSSAPRSPSSTRARSRRSR